MFEIYKNSLVKSNSENKVVILPDNIEQISPHAFKNNNVVEKIIGNGVTKIFYSVFENNENLKSIEFPNLLHIGNYYGCKNLSHMLINSKTRFRCVSEIHPNLKVDILSNSKIYSFESNNSIIKKYSDFVPDVSNKFFEIYITQNKNEFSIPNIINDCDTNDLLMNGLTTTADNISSILEETMAEIFDNGYVINIVNDRIYIQGHGAVAGVCSPTTKEILIDCQDIEHALSHEIGHAYDFIYNISSSLEFLTIYNLEHGNLYTKNNTYIEQLNRTRFEHFRSTPQEFFAETFKLFFRNKEKLLLECPLVYEYFSEFFNSKKHVKINSVNTQ